MEQTCRRLNAEELSQQASPAARADGEIPRRGPGRPGNLWLADPYGRFNLVYDDGWRIIEQQSDQTVLRLIDHGRLLGQVSIVPLPPTAEAPGLAAFQDDIECSLAGQFNHLVEATESRRSNGTRILRVASDGEADGLPFRWIHYHVATGNGAQATLSFMVESGQQERFGEADRLFVDGFVITAIIVPIIEKLINPSIFSIVCQIGKDHLSSPSSWQSKKNSTITFSLFVGRSFLVLAYRPIG